MLNAHSAKLHFQLSPSSAGGEAAPLESVTGKGRGGFTLVEVMVAVTVLVLVAVSSTQAMLQINRRAAISRVTNAAKAEALSRIQQVSQLSYSPDANPAVIPNLLKVNANGTPITTTTNIDLGSTLTGLGSIPGTATWTVSNLDAASKIRSVRCVINYRYLGRNLSYETVTYKSPD